MAQQESRQPCCLEVTDAQLEDLKTWYWNRMQPPATPRKPPLQKYHGEVSNKEIGELCGFSRETTRNLEKRAIRKLVAKATHKLKRPPEGIDDLLEAFADGPIFD